METTDDDAPQRVPPTGKRGGKWTPVGEAVYRIPPLGLLQIQELEEDLASLRELKSDGSLPSRAQMKSVAKIVFAALSRNYAELKQTEVEDMLDLGNFWQVLMACLSTAGFKSVEGLKPGEAGRPIGATSTPP